MNSIIQVFTWLVQVRILSMITIPGGARVIQESQQANEYTGFPQISNVRGIEIIGSALHSFDCRPTSDHRL